MDLPAWDPDRPWCWATDDGWWIEVPEGATATLREVLGTAPDVIGALRVDVAGEDGDVAVCTGDELVALHRDATGRLGRLLRPVEVDEAALGELAAAAEVVAVLCHVRLGHVRLDEHGGVDPGTADLLRWTAAAEALHRELAEAEMRRIRARRDGSFRVVLAEVERRVIDDGLRELEEHLGADDPALRRLLPTAYPDDPEREAGWAALVHGELIEARRANIARVRSMLERRRLDGDELAGLMRACNDLRLVLGTRLDVSEEGRPARPLERSDRMSFALYEHLGGLVAEMVRALRTAL